MKRRLDLLLVERGLVQSRERARALILAGKVLAGDRMVDKAGTMVDERMELRLNQPDHPYVSRGGVKLACALDCFKVDPGGVAALDVGISTGGFTDCLLKRKAAIIYGIDVGYGQLAWSLKQDERVVLLERTNIRKLDRELIKHPIGLAVVDVSFISLTLVLEHLTPLLADRAEVVALVKPQFEAPRGSTVKGVVKDEAIRLKAVERVLAHARALGFACRGQCPSPIQGAKGNVEIFLHLQVQKT